MTKYLVIFLVTQINCAQLFARPFVDLLNLKYTYSPKTDFRQQPEYQTSAMQITGELFVTHKNRFQ